MNGAAAAAGVDSLVTQLLEVGDAIASVEVAEDARDLVAFSAELVLVRHCSIPLGSMGACDSSAPWAGPGVGTELLMLKLLLLIFQGERSPKLDGVGGEKGNFKIEVG